MYEGDDEYEVPAVKANWADYAHNVLQVAGGVFGGFLNMVEDLQGTLAQHSMFLQDRDKFAREAGMEIESLSDGGGHV